MRKEDEFKKYVESGERTVYTEAPVHLTAKDQHQKFQRQLSTVRSAKGPMMDIYGNDQEYDDLEADPEFSARVPYKMDKISIESEGLTPSNLHFMSQPYEYTRNTEPLNQNYGKRFLPHDYQQHEVIG